MNIRSKMANLANVRAFWGVERRNNWPLDKANSTRHRANLARNSADRATPFGRSLRLALLHKRRANGGQNAQERREGSRTSRVCRVQMDRLGRRADWVGES